MIDGYVRLASIGLRRYTAETQNRDCASRLLLTNALRLCVAEVGEIETARLVLEVLQTRPGKPSKDAA
jgi:hypothetical protein